jgi:Fe-S-cluster containining protein
MNQSVEERLCLACGFCCDGTLFTRVRLQSEDSVESLKSAQLRLQQDDQGDWIMQQPCSGYRQDACQTYHCRPARCGLFRCTLLRYVEAGEVSEAEALSVIRDTKQTRNQLITELEKVFPGFQAKAMAEILHRLRKESRKLAGERLKLFRAARSLFLCPEHPFSGSDSNRRLEQP